MIKANATYTALFGALLLAACEASAPGSAKHVNEARGDEVADDEGGDAVSDDLDTTPQSDDEDSDAPEPPPAPSPGAPEKDPGSTPTHTAPASDAPADAAPRWFLKGTTSPTFAAGKAQKAALQAGANVRLSLLSDLGVLKIVADAKVDLDGKFTIALPLDVSIDLGIADLLDVSGNIVGSVIVGGGKGKADAILNLAPISAETSLEVQVLLAATQCPSPAATKPSALSLALDVSALIDASLSNALDAALKLGANLDLVTHGLADAVVAASHARAEVLADIGVELDLGLMVDAQLKSLLQLEQDLCDVALGKAKLIDVSAKLALSLDAALAASTKLDADLRVRAHVAASLAFSSSVAASFKVDAKLNASIFEAVHAAAALEAEVTAQAVVELLKSAGASAANLQVAIDAGLKLKADVTAALDLRALTIARNKFIDAVCGKPSAGGGLVGGLLSGVTGVVSGVVGGLLGSVLDLSLNLDVKLSLDLDKVAQVNACASVDASLSLDASLAALADTLAKFDADVHASAGSSADAKLAAKLLVSAQLFGRASI